MGISKVIYDGQTLVDLTGDTVTPETLAEGVTAHGADGEPIVGTMVTTDIGEYLKSVSCTLTASGWTMSSGGTYIQSVEVSWMTGTWRPGIPILESSMDTQDDYDIQEAWGCVDAITSGGGTLTFSCYGDPPEVDITCIVPRFVV